MNLKIKAFGIAKDILGEQELSFNHNSGKSVKSLKDALVASYPEFAKLASFSVAVNQEYQDDDFTITESDEVVIIPPVSGG